MLAACRRGRLETVLDFSECPGHGSRPTHWRAVSPRSQPGGDWPSIENGLVTPVNVEAAVLIRGDVSSSADEIGDSVPRDNTTSTRGPDTAQSSVPVAEVSAPNGEFSELSSECRSELPIITQSLQRSGRSAGPGADAPVLERKRTRPCHDGSLRRPVVHGAASIIVDRIVDTSAAGVLIGFSAAAAMARYPSFEFGMCRYHSRNCYQHARQFDADASSSLTLL